MTSSRRTIRTLATLLPLGALGISVALAAAPVRANAAAADGESAAPGVAAKLRAIRGAVSEVAAKQADVLPDNPDSLKAWWGNYRPGWGGGWGNGGWRNWHNGWRNGGWFNGGWANGGWPNFWRNW